MIWPAYRLATLLAVPPFFAIVAATPGYRPLRGRLRPPAGMPLSTDPIWLHACSVGEVNAAKPLLAALADRYPGIPRVLTASTVSGEEQAKGLSELAHVAWFPFDQVHIVRRFLDAVRPRCLIILETELWPNVIRETARRNIPIAVANARLSDRHFRRYRRARPLMSRVLREIRAIGAQSEAYAERFQALGADPSNVTVTGNVKFDGAPLPLEPEERNALRRGYGIAPEAPVVVFGSTRPGDEALAEECRTRLRGDHSNVRVVIAPRHLDRVREVVRVLAPEEYVLRSALEEAPVESKPVILVDVFGELTRFYGIADVAVIGGSFYPGVEGHNPIEPAAQGIPTVFGPHMRNFRDAARSLVDGGGAVRVNDAAELADALARLLREPEKRAAMGTAARRTVELNRGAVARHLTAFSELLDPIVDSIDAKK